MDIRFNWPVDLWVLEGCIYISIFISGKGQKKIFLIPLPLVVIWDMIEMGLVEVYVNWIPHKH